MLKVFSLRNLFSIIFYLLAFVIFLGWGILNFMWEWRKGSIGIHNFGELILPNGKIVNLKIIGPVF